MLRARKAILWAVPGLCAGLFALPSFAGAATGGTAAGSHANVPAPTATAGALAVSPSTLNERQVATVTGAVPGATTGAPHGL